MTWRFELATDIGGRAEQQDRVEVLVAPDRPDDYLVILADGMGGQLDGAAAAQSVIDTARHAFTNTPAANPKQFLTDLCRKAHDAITDIGRQRQTNPASTCTILYIRDNEAYWVHVGDSRLYHFKADKLLSRTQDHSVSELLKGDGQPGRPEHSSNSADNRLYMCLGGQNELTPEFGATAVGENDWFMLCSDGFWQHVDPNEVIQVLKSSSSKRKAARDLAIVAKRRGGAYGDNVSLALAIYEYQQPRPAWRRFLPSGIRFGK